ncbi:MULTISPECIES: GNAT family N-acetyltransferase [unclassified Streptomyces]|uniref:GNAT family N-acetyltransferase n=1 Tax=unclassified Streptomyces TaxID=2593676 RepID=UPI0008051F94|nr:MULTISPECIES: GNAT family N-acetyltransferase [unclassified Streptomyces]MYR75738.1 GNAT family N-acetyltransferase [Streptomyces sp. SID4925]SBU89147.1 Acetyltransferases [Streptomyces sp. OspMP-M45]
MADRATGLRRPEEFRDVYHRVYREAPYHEDAAAADGFAGQLAAHAALPGFSVTSVPATPTTLAAPGGGALGGFAYGVRREEGWWHPRAAAPAPGWLRGSLFYVYELAVVAELRGRGHGRELLDLLLADRPEPYAVLAASNKAPARELYRRWGWEKVGELTGPPDGVDLLALRLTPEP